MPLLIQRDKTLLEKCKGTARVDKDVPDTLKHTMIVPQRTLLIPPKPCRLEDKLITTTADRAKLKKFLRTKITTGIPALWAGYRSVIVDCGSGELYKLKGVTVNLEDPDTTMEICDKDPDIFGGQYLYSSEYEQQMTDEFNKTLAKEGIEPAMQFKGYWNYKLKVNDKPLSASVIKIKGDTRLDEFMDAIEEILFQRIMLNTPNKQGQKILEKVVTLYQDIGFVVGRLKRLMNKNNQSWGSDPCRTNAHTGNVVLYTENDALRLGFVDFDASSSCKADKLSQQEIKELQKGDYSAIIYYAKRKQCSPRQFAGDTYCILFWMNEHEYDNFLRNNFCEGFKKGHDSATYDKNRFDNKIPSEQIMEILSVLKSGVKLAKKSKSLSSGYASFISHADFMSYEYRDHIKKLLLAGC